MTAIDDIETEYRELQARFDADYRKLFGHGPDEFDWRSFRVVAGSVAVVAAYLTVMLWWQA